MLKSAVGHRSQKPKLVVRIIQLAKNPRSKIAEQMRETAHRRMPTVLIGVAELFASDLHELGRSCQELASGNWELYEKGK